MKKNDDRMMFFGLLAKDISPRKVPKDQQQTATNGHINLPIQCFMPTMKCFIKPNMMQ